MLEDCRNGRHDSQVLYLHSEIPRMARWPDNWKSNLLGFLIVFVLFPLLCWLAWWWLQG